MTIDEARKLIGTTWTDGKTTTTFEAVEESRRGWSRLFVVENGIGFFYEQHAWCDLSRWLAGATEVKE